MRVIRPADIAGKNGPDIGKLWSFVPAAIRGEVRIDPSTYRPFSGRWRQLPSGNWGEAAIACDIINLALGFPTLLAPTEIVAYLRAKNADREWMTNEFGSWVYLNLHAEPTVVQLAMARRLSESATDPWVDIADGLNDWMRAMVGYLTITGCWGQGADWEGKKGPGARLLTGKGSPSARVGGARYCVLTGKRSWHYDGSEWRHNLFAPIYLSWFGLGERRTGGDILPLVIPEAIKEAHGYDLAVLTAQEHALVAAAITNDIPALKWAVRELIRDYEPRERNTFMRTERGVCQVVHKAGKSPTATTYYSDWIDTGITHAAGCCDGLRGAKGEHVEPGIAAFDIAARTGYCVRTEGEPRPIIPFSLPPGPLVSVISLGGGLPSEERWFVNGVEPSAPSPAPSPEPERERPDRNRGCMLLGRRK